MEAKGAGREIVIRFRREGILRCEKLSVDDDQLMMTMISGDDDDDGDDECDDDAADDDGNDLDDKNDH